MGLVVREAGSVTEGQAEEVHSVDRREGAAMRHSRHLVAASVVADSRRRPHLGGGSVKTRQFRIRNSEFRTSSQSHLRHQIMKTAAHALHLIGCPATTHTVCQPYEISIEYGIDPQRGPCEPHMSECRW